MPATLVQFEAAISTIYPAAHPGVDYTITTDTSGNNSIHLWNPAIGTLPTDDQIATALAANALNDAKSAQLAILEVAFNAAYSANIAYMTSTFPTDDPTKIKLGFAKDWGDCEVAAGNNLPSDFAVIDINGAPVAMTFTQLKALIAAIGRQSYAAFIKMAALEAELNAATTVAAVQAIVWS